MGTTLWFTEKDKLQDMPQTIVSAGQYNICWNLLKYINNLKKSMENTNETHHLILECQQQLDEDWMKFQKDLMWLFHEKM